MPWALGTFDAGEGTFPGVVVDERRVHDASPVAPSVRAIFERWHETSPQLEELAGSDGGSALDDVRVLAPIEPRQVLQAGANYYKHVLDIIVAERTRAGVDEEKARGEAREIMDARVATGEPFVFLGAVGAICGPYDDVILPRRGEQHDWELELAAVLGPAGAIVGYTMANDLTTRDLVYREDLKAIGTDWLRSKNAPTFLPAGPWIVPAQFVDPASLRVTLRAERRDDAGRVDGGHDLRRRATPGVRSASGCRLFPGDLLLTGSPAGNGMHWGRFLTDGDVIDAEITGLGRHRNRVVAS